MEGIIPRLPTFMAFVGSLRHHYLRFWRPGAGKPQKRQRSLRMCSGELYISAKGRNNPYHSRYRPIQEDRQYISTITSRNAGLKIISQGYGVEGDPTRVTPCSHPVYNRHKG